MAIFERPAIRVRESRRGGGTPIAEMVSQAETSGCAAYAPEAYAAHRVINFDLLTEIFVATIGGGMLSWAIAFLVIGIVAAIFGFTGIAGTAVNIAWILAVLGIILFVVFLVLGRRPPV